MSVRTAKKTQHFTVATITRLMLFKEIIPAYYENHKENIIQNAELPLGFRGLNAFTVIYWYFMY
jgi:hypothetical protein